LSHSIEDFRGNFEELATMIEASWLENPTTPFLYTAVFLASLFAYPGASSFFAPTLYRGSEPIAFVAGFPRRIRLFGRELQVMVAALLTVAREYKSSGYGILVWSELVRRAREAGLNGVVNYCIEGEAMDRMIVGGCRRLDVPVSRVCTASYLSRVLLRRRSEGGDASSEISAAEFAEIASTVTAEVPLARRWSLAEAEWQCRRPGIVSVSQNGSGPGQGVLTGYVMPLANPSRTRCLVIEDVLWGNTEPDGREVLVKELVGNAAAAGAQVAIVPDLGYADLSPFTAAKFRPSGRRIHAYLSLFDDALPAGELPGYYLDVF